MRTIVVLALASASAAACNEHVFRYVPDECVAEQVVSRSIPKERAADILLVIDNSTSMCEEQDELARNFFDVRCDVTSDDVAGSADLRFDNIKPAYQNPTDQQVLELSQRCGFIQILAAYDNDFRVGVITTDVSGCDNNYDVANGTGPDPANPVPICGDRLDPGWGHKPQRGCLQAPAGAKKTFDRGDADVGSRFQETLQGVGVYGSSFERGLDAMEIFLTPSSDRAAGCEDDLGLFLRDDAKLVVIFLTDEEDCSHAGTGFPDENKDEVCTVDAYRDPSVTVRPGVCYPSSADPGDADAGSRFADLAPVSRYAAFLDTVKGRDAVRVAVIGGFAPGEDGQLVPAACSVGPDGAPDVVCRATQGSSNSPECRPDDAVPCCKADPATRYQELATTLGADRARTNSICSDSFRETMIGIARFISADDFIELKEAADDPAAIVVLLTKDGAEAPTVVERLPDGSACETSNGWILTAPTHIQLCGTGVPRPGDDISVHAREDRGGDAGCRLPPAR